VADRTRSGSREEALGGLAWLWASCEKVSLSECDLLDRRLSGWERLMVSAHQFSCPACRRFRRQVRSLRAALALIRARREARDRLAGLLLPPDVRRRIKAAVRGANDPGGPALPGAPTD
jgi:hypothetical protein